MSVLAAATVSAAPRAVPSRPARRRARALRVTSRAREDSPSQSPASARLGTRGPSFHRAVSLESPASSSKNDDDDAAPFDVPETTNVLPSDIGQTGQWPPLLVFVNGKSGGRRGEALRESLIARKDLNALACVDLTMPGASPTPALKEYVGKVPDLRVLVCGGDGTVAWVLQALEELTEVRSRPVAQLIPSPALGNDHVFIHSRLDPPEERPSLTKSVSSRSIPNNTRSSINPRWASYPSAPATTSPGSSAGAGGTTTRS